MGATNFGISYSAGQKKRYEYCLMKQKFQLQIGIAQYKHPATPLSTKGIHTRLYISTLADKFWAPWAKKKLYALFESAGM